MTYWVQESLGVVCFLFFYLPFHRVTRGWERIPERKVLYVCNHVSLLDTILIGGIFWRRRRVPLLVLGDRTVWRATWIRRVLSAKLGFLISRDRHCSRSRLAELEAFGSSSDFDRLVFPEGTRGSGSGVKRVQPGIYFVAQAARIPIVPLYIENMHLVSTKRTGFHPLGGLGKLGFHVGSPIAPEDYLSLERDDFVDLIRHRLTALAQRVEEGAQERNEHGLGSLLASEPRDIGATGG